jgi:hypothetical protein
VIWLDSLRATAAHDTVGLHYRLASEGKARKGEKKMRKGRKLRKISSLHVHRYFILALSLPLITFVLNTLIALKDFFFSTVTYQNDLALTSLLFYRVTARTKDFRKRYLYLPKVVEKRCCLRPTSIKLHNSK